MGVEELEKELVECKQGQEEALRLMRKCEQFGKDREFALNYQPSESFEIADRRYWTLRAREQQLKMAIKELKDAAT